MMGSPCASTHLIWESAMPAAPNNSDAAMAAALMPCWRCSLLMAYSRLAPALNAADQLSLWTPALGAPPPRILPTRAQPLRSQGKPATKAPRSHAAHVHTH